MLKLRETHRRSEIIYPVKARIRSKLQSKSGRKPKLKDTPMVCKDRWAKDIMDQLHKVAETLSERRLGQIQPTSRTSLGRWADQKWEERWKHYLDLVPTARITPSNDDKLGWTRNKLQQGLRKVESSTAIQLRTEKVEFAAFFFCMLTESLMLWSPRTVGVGWPREKPKACCPVLPQSCEEKLIRSSRKQTGIEKFRRRVKDSER